ncbi:hypothetical protein Tco_0870345 [Tanacetum coccineum]
MGLHTAKEIESVGFGAYWAESARQIPDEGDLSSLPVASLGGVRYLRLFASGRKQGDMIFEVQFVARLAEHFRLLTEERL